MLTWGLQVLSCSFVLFLTWLLNTTVYFWSVCCVWILCWEHKLMPTTSHCTALCMRAELWRAHTTASYCCAVCYICRAVASSHPLCHTALYLVCRAVGQLSAPSYSGCTRFLLVVVFFFFLLPFASFEVQGFVKRDRRVMVCLLWGGKHG